MSSNLIDRIRAARQTRVPVGDITLICRRPTNIEAAELRENGVTQFGLLTRFVDGWEGMTELHLTSGGTGALVRFDRDLFAEWVADHPESWGVIAEAVVDGYRAHEQRQEEASKNLQPGSKV